MGKTSSRRSKAVAAFPGQIILSYGASLAKVAIVIPVYNEPDGLKRFLKELVRKLPLLASGISIPVDLFNIIVVDDGSSSALQLDGVAPSADVSCKIFLLRHAVNLGQGAALQTGIEFSVEELRCDYFVTLDADGQHRPEDVPVLFNELLSKSVDIVFGNRFDKQVKVHAPFGRRMLLKAAIIFERWVSGLKLSDAHNGFRVFNQKCAKLIKLEQNRMAHATEFKQLVQKHKLSYAEAPVAIHYSEETLMKGQKNIGSLFILKDLLKAYLFKG